MVLLRPLLCTLLYIAPFVPTLAKNFIRYHQRSLLVQEHMVRGEYEQAIHLLTKLERTYGLMPTETFARALCQVALRDTAAARQSYLQSITQGASLGWLYFSQPLLNDRNDTLWYQQIIAACEVQWSELPRYADGPNEGMPTPTSTLNQRHQFLLDSMGLFDSDPEHELYQKLIDRNNRMLDSMINGQLPVPTIARYGMNSEFETFLLHTSTSLKVSEHRTIKGWLKEGLIYPRTYAICFDDLALEENRPFPYGFFIGLRPEELAPGHQRRCAAIGMGDDAMERRRFHFGTW
jgi:hypothetical protein